jgi:hypothetical protein
VTTLLPTRGSQGDQSARVVPTGPLVWRQGVLLDEVTWIVKQRPVDTTAVARKVAEEEA